jgi:DNA-binding NarL/FixJ family response regulator
VVRIDGIVDSHQLHREGLTSLRRHSSPLQDLVDEFDSVAKLSINALDKILRREDLGNDLVLIDLFLWLLAINQILAGDEGTLRSPTVRFFELDATA